VFGKKTDKQLKVFMTIVSCSACSLFYDFVAGRRQPMEREVGTANNSRVLHNPPPPSPLPPFLLPEKFA
jgi:hypothetical protein